MLKKEILRQIQIFCPQEDKQMLEMAKLTPILYCCCLALIIFKKKHQSPLVLIFSFFSPSLLWPFFLSPWPLTKPSQYISFPRQLQYQHQVMLWILWHCWFIPSPGSYELPHTGLTVRCSMRWGLETLQSFPVSPSAGGAWCHAQNNEHGCRVPRILSRFIHTQKFWKRSIWDRPEAEWNDYSQRALFLQKIF